MTRDLVSGARSTLVAAGLAALLAGAPPLAGPVQAAGDIIIGAHEAGSTFYVYGAAIADIITKHTDKTGKLLTSAGPGVWMPMMAGGEADLGVVSHYDGWSAWKGRGAFPRAFDVRLVLVGGGINVGLYVRKDSPIKSRDDLKGKRIGARYSGAPTIGVYAEAEIANAGLSWTDVVAMPRTSLYAGQREDVTEGRLDVFYASIGAGITRELDSTIGIRFLPLDTSEDALARMRAVYPAVVSTVKAGPPGVEQDMPLTYLPVYLIAYGSVSDENVYTAVKALADHNEELRKANPALGGWRAEGFASTDAILPYHPGAIRYYREAGVWSADIEAAQKKLADGS